MRLKGFADGDQWKVVVKEERIDIVNAETFKKALLRYIQKGKKVIVLDLGKVAFIDSSGLGALVFGLREARKRGGTLKLCHLQDQVRSIFEITRLNKIFEIL